MRAVEVTKEFATTSAAPPRLAVAPVLALAGTVAVLLLVTANRYGLTGDELYFVIAGRRFTWGYADQPPLVPLLAAVADQVAPGSAVVLRLPAAGVPAAGVVVAALITRELGGRARAQLLAAGVTAGCSYLLSTGRTVATSTFDPFWWSLALWLIVRWVRIENAGEPGTTHRTPGRASASVERHDPLLVIAGVVIAAGLLTKLLMLGLLVGLLAGVLLVGPRRMLSRPFAWVGAALAVAALAPTLLWQGLHGWPQVGMAVVIADEPELFGSRWQILPFALLGAGLLPGVVLVSAGLWALLRMPELRPWRFIGVAVVVVAAAVIVLGGRSYYLGGFYVTLFAAGAVALQLRNDQLPPTAPDTGTRPGEHPSGKQIRRRRWVRWMVAPLTVAVFGVLNMVLALPVGPVQFRIGTDFVSTMQVGWPDLADSVAEVYEEVPAGKDGRTVIVASSYWNASALAYYGPDRGLPAVYSGHRGYGFFGPPPGTTPALLIGNVPWADRVCATLTPLPPHTATIANPINGSVPISYCRPRQPWSQVWPTLQTL